MKLFHGGRLTLAGVVTWLIALALGTIVVLMVRDWMAPDPWSPLGPYKVQTVHSQGPEIKAKNSDANVLLPVVHLGTPIKVTGTKCSKESTVVQGQVGWRSVDPAGFDYQVPPGAPGYRLAGCQTADFKNDIPPAVDAWARSVIEDGDTPELFFGGCETPKRDGKSGETVCWRTEPFVLVP
jgi:hypothetical protein